jgi:hypothetical protein
MTTEGQDSDQSSVAPLTEDHQWLHDAEAELDLDITLPRTTKVGKARLVKVRRAPGARKPGD